MSLPTPKCPVCLDMLIAPITFSCGHSTCTGCYEVLRASGSGVGVLNCPECRTSISRECKMNIVLDQVLSTIIPDYEETKKTRLDILNRTTLFKRYKNSRRYNNIAAIMRRKLNRDGYATLKDFQELDYSAMAAPHPDEIMFIIHNKGIKVLKIVIKDVTYYVYSGDVYENHIFAFAEAHKDELTPAQLYRIAASLDSNVEMLFDRLHLLPEDEVNETIVNTDALRSFLLTVDITMLTGPGNSSDTDDSDSDLHSDSDDDDTSNES